MSKAALLELADRVEKATGNSWSLDKAIFLAVDVPMTVMGSKVISWFGDGPFGCNTEDGRRHLDYINAPNYTASLDAAMTLVPEGALFSVGHRGDDYPGQYIGTVMPLSGRILSTHSTAPALALTAASLRARAQQESKDA
jgi:hypothetical protein